jgi:hypothetical protein
MANKIETCVRDLVQIAEGSRNLEMAKALVENLLDDAKFQHQQAAARFPTAQQLRDALSPVYNALGGGAKQFIGDVIDWLRSEHLGRSDSGTASWSPPSISPIDLPHGSLSGAIVMRTISAEAGKNEPRTEGERGGRQ